MTMSERIRVLISAALALGCLVVYFFNADRSWLTWGVAWSVITFMMYGFAHRTPEKKPTTRKLPRAHCPICGRNVATTTHKNVTRFRAHFGVPGEKIACSNSRARVDDDLVYHASGTGAQLDIEHDEMRVERRASEIERVQRDFPIPEKTADEQFGTRSRFRRPHHGDVPPATTLYRFTDSTIVTRDDPDWYDLVVRHGQPTPVFNADALVSEADAAAERVE